MDGPDEVQEKSCEGETALGLREERGDSAEQAGGGDSPESRLPGECCDCGQRGQSAEPVVGGDHGDVVVEDQEEQAGQQDEQAGEYAASEQRDDGEERESKGDAPGLEKPGVDAEEAKARGVEQVGARGNEFEEVAIEDLSVKNVNGADEEESLVVVGDEGSGGKEKGSKIEECGGAGESEGK